jgi:glycerol kinase
MNNSDKSLIGAIDAGTGSIRFMVFSAKDFQLITYHQEAVKIISSQGGFVVF